MKYFISIILITALISCGGGDKKKSPDTMEETKTETTEETTATEEITESEEEATEEVAEMTTETDVNMEEKAAPKDNETDKKVTASKSEWTGYTVNVAAVTKGDTKKLDKNTAMTLYKNNQVLGFLSDDKVYLVYNSSGVYDAKELVRNADSGSFTIGGTMKNINGMNVIIAKSYK